MEIEYITNSSIGILIGREKFVWDDPEYMITGDYGEDGYTILYNNDKSNHPDEISAYNNLAAMSMTKLTALPEIEFEMARSGGYQNIYLNDRTYVISNTVHFLAERMFANTVASEHATPCILQLNLTGGLFSGLASREFCDECKAKIYRAGPGSRASKSFSCSELIDNLQSMVKCLDRIEKIKRVGNALKLAASAAFTLFGVSLISNVLVNYTSDITFGELVRRYLHPIEIAVASVVAGILFLIGFAFCRWVSPGKRVEI